MRRLTFLMTGVIFIAACGEPPPNNNTNTITSPDAPTREALFELDKKATEAWIKGDAKSFDALLSEKFVSSKMGQRTDKTGLLKMVGQFECDVKSWSLDDPQMSVINSETAVLSYKGTYDGSCAGPDGKAMRFPSPVRAASIYLREGVKWMSAYHGENMIIDPKNAAPPPIASNKKNPNNVDAKKNVNAGELVKPPETKPATGDANTEALTKLHNAVWEAWRAKDAKRIEDLTAKDFSLVDPFGNWFGTKTDALRSWSEMKCESVTKITFTDGVATELSPTVEILTGKRTADGTCDGQKNGDLWITAFYVKERDAWKLAFMFEEP